MEVYRYIISFIMENGLGRVGVRRVGWGELAGERGGVWEEWGCVWWLSEGWGWEEWLSEGWGSGAVISLG